jgi:glycerophosphoryl diester phosphodiesterase
MSPRLRLAIALLLLVPGAPLLAQQKGGPLPNAKLFAIDPQTAQGLKELLGHSPEPLPLLSAHRGGAARGFPENCLATFENTLRQTFAILEVDPRLTRDGAIVIHHDATLNRTTTGRGRVADHDLAELKKLRLKDPQGNVTDYVIPTLDEALEWARGKTVLVLDEKDVPVKARVKKIEQHRAEAYAMLIVYSLEGARECYALNKNIMMEVMITNRKQFEAFDKSGIPWSNIIAFVGHEPPSDRELLSMIRAKGACCVAGTSRNLDRELAAARDGSDQAIAQKYRALLDRGVDFFEADLAGEVGRMLYADAEPPAAKAKYFRGVVAGDRRD